MPSRWPTDRVADPFAAALLVGFGKPNRGKAREPGPPAHTTGAPSSTARPLAVETGPPGQIGWLIRGEDGALLQRLVADGVLC